MIIDYDTNPNLNTDQKMRSLIDSIHRALEENSKSNLLNMFYPIGSYYETSDTAFDPNKAWGGRWILEVEGQVHVSAGTNYTVAGALTNTNDSGNKDAIIPAHYHSVNAQTISGGGHSHTVYAKYTQNRLASGSARTQYYGDGTSTGTSMATIAANTGTHSHSVAAHNTNSAVNGVDVTDKNMPPYIVVNRWHRVA